MNRLTQRLATTIACLALAAAGTAWTGCGDDDVNDAVDDAQEQGQNAVDQAQESAKDAKESLPDDAQQKIDDAGDKASEAADDAGDKASEAADDAGDKASEAADDVTGDDKGSKEKGDDSGGGGY